MTITNSIAPARTPPAPHRVQARGLVVAGAVGAALGEWLVAGPLLGIDLAVQPAGGGAQSATQTVGIGAVVAASLTAALLGWALLALLERWTARARTIWTAVAAVVLLLSLAGPLTGALSLSVAGALAAVHLVVGSVLIVGLRRTATGAGTAAA